MASSKFPLSFWLLSTGALLFFVSFNLVLPELPSHLRELGGGDYLGLIIPVFSLSALVSRPLSGYITDQWGRKWALVAGTLFCILAGLLYPFSGTVWFFFMVRMIHGFSTGFTPTGFVAYAGDVVDPAHRGKAMGWLGLFNNAGTSIGYGVGAWIVADFGRDGLYTATALSALLALLLFSRLPETFKSAEPRPLEFKISRWLHRETFLPAVLMLLVCVSLGSVLTIMPDYTEFRGFDNKGLFLSLYIAASLFVRLISGTISDRFGRPLSVAIGTGFQILSMAVLIGVSNSWGFWAGAILYGLGQGFNAPALFAWSSDLSSKENRGSATAMLFMALETGIIIGGLAAGFLVTRGLGYSSAFALNGLCFVLAFGWALQETLKTRNRAHS
ncbi:MAG: MFS transporter [Bacteroidetes bacterium]|nr:MFS transporter [Bacteroidota bacterium]MDA0944037.1 MFS transporter [Bacteroidota bacterium]MDA1112505.1 MFS transporter [Bacteroidota bacterium]